jgi:hypothetical protein
MTKEEAALQNQVFAAFTQISEAVREIGAFRTRPILGGVFGTGGFHLMSRAFILSGLCEVRYFVREVESGAVISYGETKQAALSMARNVLTKLDVNQLAMYFGRVKAERLRQESEARQRVQDAEAEAAARRSPKVKSISRRRRQIFDE